MKPLPFEKNEVLFGSDHTEGIVTVEPVGEDKMRLFLRRGNRLETLDEPFTPFLLLENEKLLQGFKQPFRFEKFSSTNEYKVLALFEQWGDCAKARTFLHKKT